MKYCFLFLFFGLSLKMFAQQKKGVLPYTSAVSISPLALADIDHSLMIGTEYRFHAKWSVVADAGYVFNSDYIRKSKGTSGINARSALRYYYGRKRQDFWQAQFLYKQVDYKLHDWLGKNCVDDVPAYDQLQDFTFRKRVWGINVMAGEIMPVFSDHFFLEINAGIGIRYKKQEVANIENACYERERPFGASTENETWLPSAPFSAKLFYVIK